MAAYRKKASADRDALFGDMGGGGGGSRSKKSSASSNRDELFGNSSGGGSKHKPSRPAAAPTPAENDPMARLREMKKNKNRRPILHGEVREEKLKGAKEYREKANKCMQSSFFSKPDPVAASTYFKRAADAYQQVGDMPREERLFRLESGKCNQLIEAWASVASDFTRAAELLQQQMEDGQTDPTIANPSMEASSYHKEAANAWTQMGEKSKAAGSQIKAAIALNSGVGSKISKQALTVMEEAIEAHVPDVFNPFARYRQTGNSAFIDPDSEETIANPSAATKELAQEHIVTAAYAHEPLQELVYLLAGQYREYPSALYAAGAATTLLERSGMATLSTSRAYVTETILLLAAGDAVAAQQVFLNRHVQQTFYLQSRECKLAEELFRAIMDRDPDALEEVRSPAGENRAALANLHPSLRHLVTELRVSGVARKQKDAPKKKAVEKKSSSSEKKKKEVEEPASAATDNLSDLANMKTGYEEELAAGANMDSGALAAELDGLDFGLDDDSDGGLGGGDDDDDDDDFDLR